MRCSHWRAGGLRVGVRGDSARRQLCGERPARARPAPDAPRAQAAAASSAGVSASWSGETSVSATSRLSPGLGQLHELPPRSGGIADNPYSWRSLCDLGVALVARQTRRAARRTQRQHRRARARDAAPRRAALRSVPWPRGSGRRARAAASRSGCRRASPPLLAATARRGRACNSSKRSRVVGGVLRWRRPTPPSPTEPRPAARACVRRSRLRCLHPRGTSWAFAFARGKSRYSAFVDPFFAVESSAQPGNDRRAPRAAIFPRSAAIGAAVRIFSARSSSLTRPRCLNSAAPSRWLAAIVSSRSRRSSSSARLRPASICS